MNTGKVFDAYGRYYDLLYQDKDYRAEADYIDRLLTAHGVAGASLLEFGSGTGKHGRLLGERGYRVHGVERSAEMVARATATPGFTCQQGDICTVQMGQTYDSVFSLFHVVSYQTSNASLLAVFGRAAEHLEAGGFFLFDFWYTPAVYAQRPAVRCKRISDETVEITRIAEPINFPNENRVDVNYTIFARNVETGEVQTFSESHPMRHFSLPEIDVLAQMHGFKRVMSEEFLTGNMPSEDTWGVCVLLRRI